MHGNQRSNRIRSILSDGGVAFGPTVQTASPDLIEMAGRAGYDFAWIDCEHGAFSFDRLLPMLRACDGAGMTPVVRVPGLDTSLIARVLDAGAMGVILPNLTSREQARQLWCATRYKHDENGGVRGACPSIRAASHLTRDWPGFVAWSNVSVMAWGMIESMEGVANIQEILDVPLDGIALGPFDLAHDMGHAGQPGHPKVVQALEIVTRAALAKGVPVIGTLFSATEREMAAELAWWKERGVRIFSTGTDRSLIVSAMEARLAAGRSCAPVAAAA